MTLQTHLKSDPLYSFGGNASVSVHISVPCPLNDTEIQEATKYAVGFCETVVQSQLKQYTTFLNEQGIDWKKVENNVK